MKTGLQAIFGGAFNKKISDTNKAERAAEFQCLLGNIPSVPIERKGKFHSRNFAKEGLAKMKYRDLPRGASAEKLGSFVALDVETTGLELTGNEVIELSAVRFENLRPVEKFETLICPKKAIPAQAVKVHHITNEMVQGAPKFYEIIPSFDEFIGDLPLVAHNASFDISHLFVNGLDSMADKVVYDTLLISRKKYKHLENHKLATVCAANEIFFDGAHRASADSLACGLLFVRMIMGK